jgi:hypothetical protein
LPSTSGESADCNSILSGSARPSPRSKQHGEATVETADNENLRDLLRLMERNLSLEMIEHRRLRVQMRRQGRYSAVT